MSLPDLPTALHVWPDGSVRVRGTRVTLDSLVAQFRSGATPEQTAHSYPSVDLADLYDAFAYIIRHPSEVAAYEGARGEGAHSPDPAAQTGLRERLAERLRARTAA